MGTSDVLRDPGVPDELSAALGVVAEGRTYRNVLYLLLSFPLGALYVTVLVTVAAVGLELGLLGVVVLPVALGAVHALAWVERGVTAWVLDLESPTDERPRAWLREVTAEPPSARALLRRTRRLAFARRTWTRLGYLLVKFPVGVTAFSVVTFLGTMSAVMLGAPLLYDDPGTRFQVLRPVATVVVPVAERAGFDVGGMPTLAVSGTPHVVESLAGALVTAGAGAALGVVSLHLFNVLARASGWLATVMLQGERPG